MKEPTVGTMFIRLLEKIDNLRPEDAKIIEGLTPVMLSGGDYYEPTADDKQKIREMYEFYYGIDGQFKRIRTR